MTITYHQNFLKVPEYILFPGTTFVFFNCCWVWMYLSVVQIFGLALRTLSKFVFLSSWSTVELFSSTRICWNRSSTVMRNISLRVLKLDFAHHLNLCCSCCRVLLSNHSLLFFFLMSLFWFSVSLSITFNWVFLSSWSISFSSLRILTYFSKGDS